MAVLPTGIGPVTGYNIERSLRFNSADSAYLNRTPASATNRDTLTISLWHKRSALGSLEIICQQGADTNNSSSLIFNSSNQLEYNHVDSGSTTDQCITSAVFRDVGAWYHIVLAIDTTQATDTNRIKLYVNNVQQTLGTANYPAQNVDTDFNTTNGFRIGSQVSSTPFYLNGYLTEVNFIDGQALTPSSFGETDSATGVWKPKAFSGTYGTNGFYLKFADNSGTTSTTLGKDSSGNGNNWTPNNFSVTAGIGNDSLTDTPTAYGTDTGVGGELRGNFCTLNPIGPGAGTIANGNLQNTSGTTTVYSAISTISVDSGKWYWEVTVSAINSANQYPFIGAYRGIPNSLTGAVRPGGDVNGFSYRQNGFALVDITTFSSSWGAMANNDVIGVALDLTNLQVSFYKNNTLQGTITGLVAGTYTPADSEYNGSNVAYNFGQRPFAYTAPSGFKALCTQNLPTPTIGATSTTQAGKYFNPVLYTGNGSTQSITGVGFQPDLIWIKDRSNARAHVLQNVLAGFSQYLQSNATDAETTASSGVTAVGADGFTVGTQLAWNSNTETYVAWNWKANGAGSTNTSGTITSTVSANTTSGFSIVTYTGTTSNATVGHGLGQIPALVIIKNRTGSANNWPVWHKALTGLEYLFLNLTDAKGSNATVWNSTTPTSTVFSIGSASTTNPAQSMVAYCFAAVAGYSAFGSYTGNGSTDGPFVYTGFRPRYVLIKRTDTADSWDIWDSVRNTYNAVDARLYAQSANAETSSTQLDILSNGFKLRSTNSETNYSASTYIYAAFAESPFKYSLAR